MKKEVIVYGLGYEYKKSEALIHEMFAVKGYSDINESKELEHEDFIQIDNLAEYDQDILIVSSMYIREMIHELSSKGVSLKRIKVWLEEQKKCEILRLYRRGCIFAQAEFGEDYVIFSLLRELRINPVGQNYVEIGVCNPYGFSNTYFLHVLGWKGVLVDADPRTIELIKVVRQGQTVINKAISTKTGDKVKFYLSDEPALSSLFPENIARSKSGVIQEEIMIETISINDVMDMIDDVLVLSVDVEGYDIQALKDIDYKKYHPMIICAETGKPEDELIDYMMKVGYQLRFCNTSNTIWTYGVDMSE